MGPVELMEAIGFAVLVFLCTASLITSWQTRRLVLAVFGPDPARAQLGQRGYYVRPPDWPREPGPSPTPPAPRAPSSSGGPSRDILDAPTAADAHGPPEPPSLARDEPAAPEPAPPSSPRAAVARPPTPTPIPMALLSAKAPGLGTDDEATLKHTGPLPPGARPEDFDDQDEATRVVDRPSPEELGHAPDTQPRRVRAGYATLRSMPSVALLKPRGKNPDPE